MLELGGKHDGKVVLKARTPQGPVGGGSVAAPTSPLLHRRPQAGRHETQLECGPLRTGRWNRGEYAYYAGMIYISTRNMQVQANTEQ